MEKLNVKIEKGQFIMVFSNYENAWVRRKVLYTGIDFRGWEYVVVRVHRDMGRVYENEVKLIIK